MYPLSAIILIRNQNVTSDDFQLAQKFINDFKSAVEQLRKKNMKLVLKCTQILDLRMVLMFFFFFIVTFTLHLNVKNLQSPGNLYIT